MPRTSGMGGKLTLANDGRFSDEPSLPKEEAASFSHHLSALGRKEDEGHLRALLARDNWLIENHPPIVAGQGLLLTDHAGAAPTRISGQRLPSFFSQEEMNVRNQRGCHLTEPLGPFAVDVWLVAHIL